MADPHRSVPATSDCTKLFNDGSASAVVLDGEDCVAFNVHETELMLFVEIDGVGRSMHMPFETDEQRKFAALVMKALRRAS